MNPTSNASTSGFSTRSRTFSHPPPDQSDRVAGPHCLFPLPTDFAIRRCVRLCSPSPCLSAGFSVVQIRGRSEGREVSHRYQVTLNKGNEYWECGCSGRRCPTHL